MDARIVPLALLLAAPAFAQEAEVVTEAPEAQSVIFTCTDGRVVDIAFPDAATGVIVIDDGAPVGLALAQPAAPATGEATAATEEEAVAEATAEAEAAEPTPAIYVGNGVQWAADGSAQGTLSVLAPGETTASDPGVVCTAAE